MLIALSFAVMAVFTANAEERTKTYEFKNITGIEAGYSYDIHVTQGKSDVVTIVYESTYEDYLLIHFMEKSGVLRLGIENMPMRLLKEKGQSIKVYLDMKHVHEIELSGVASITFDGTFNTNELDVELSGASKLYNLKVNGSKLSSDCSGGSFAYIEGNFTEEVEFEVSGASKIKYNGNTAVFEGDFSGAAKFDGEVYTSTCSIECSGASSVSMEGTTKSLSLEASGACSIDTQDFVSENANVSLSGACSAKVHATNLLTHDISRTCKMTYYGDAKLQNIAEDSNIVKGR